MKLTKKILSLVLAAALVLGSIAVAANAADYDGLTYEGSKLTYKITADKTEVKPGETVTFSVYMTSNYYTGSAGGEFFLWNAGVFDALGSNYTVKNYRTKFTSTYRNPANVNSYPSNYSKTDYVGFQAVHAYNAENTQALMLDNELVYEFTFTVLETATPGATATFFIPAEALKSDALTGMKGMTYQGIATSAADATNTKAYAQTVDLSAASVTVTVASAVEYCDYTALQAALAKAPELAEEYYDAEEYKAWTDAKAAGQALLDAEALEKTDENQKTIDDAAALVESTLAALDARYLSLAKLNKAVVDYAKPAYEEEYYDADLYAAWEKALADAKAAQTDYNETMPATKQAEVDAIADALKAAYDALDPSLLDISALTKAIADCTTPAYEAEYYNADVYAAWEKALADAEAGVTTYTDAADTAANKQAVADLAKALTDAYAALVPAFLDISAVVEAIADCGTLEYSEEYYDADEYEEWDIAIGDACAAQVNYKGLPDTQQYRDEIAEIAQALRTAYANLDPRFVDASAIADAITAYGTTEYTEEYYDADEYKAYTDALAAANDADFTGKPDTEENKAAVAKIAGDLEAAYKALVARFVDYANLEQALVDFAQPEHPEFYYTTDSWANYEAALAVANDANANRPQPLPAATEANQEAVDKYADDLAAAYKALTPNNACHIISVTPLQEFYSVGDVINFEVLCEGSGFSKIQIIHDNGATNTYPRDHASVKSITVNDDGNEVWVIARRIYRDEYKEYAKAKMGKVWDNGMVSFDIKTSAEMDYEVRSVKVTLNGEEITTCATKEIPTITIVTGPDAKKVQLYEKNTGCTLTYSTPTSVNDDGSKVWVITRRFNVMLHDFDVRVKAETEVWYESEFDFALNVTETVISQLPSTGNADDAFLAAPTIASKRFLRGGTQTFGFVTDKDAKAVRIINEDGTVFVTLRAPESSDEASKTWIYKATYDDYTDYSYTVEALYGDTWIESAYGTIDFTVLY